MFRPVLRVIATASSAAAKLAKAMDIFAKVKIVQHEEDAIEQSINTLEMKMIKSFSSSHNKGIDSRTKQKIIDRLIEDYPGIDHEMRAKMSCIIFLKGQDYTVMEVKYAAGNSVVYLMVVKEERNEKYNISYVGCTFHLGVADLSKLNASEDIMNKLFINIDAAKQDSANLKVKVIFELEHFIRYLATREFEDPDKLVQAINAQDNSAE